MSQHSVEVTVEHMVIAVGSGSMSLSPDGGHIR
jgi:hypothetical protein